MLCNADGGWGASDLLEKGLRTSNFQCYQRYEGVGPISRKIGY